MNTKVLVSIPFFNQSNLLINCLKTLKNSFTKNFEYSVLIVDDGSNKTEFDHFIKNNPFEGQSQIIQNKRNIGYTETVFKIFDYAKSLKNFDYILLCNNDLKFFPDTLYYLVSRLRKNNNCSAVGCKIIHWEADIIIHTGTQVKNNKIVNPYCGLKMNDPKTNFFERRLWVNGCCCLYNLSILRKNNLNFDLNFAHAYFEESDLMTRLNILGYPVLYEPKALLRHLINGTTRHNEKFQKIFNDNWNLYLRKWKKYFKHFRF